MAVQIIQFHGQEVTPLSE